MRATSNGLVSARSSRASSKRFVALSPPARSSRLSRRNRRGDPFDLAGENLAVDFADAGND